MIFGIDVSDYQGRFNMAGAAGEGFDFVAIKCSEGSGWRSQDFATDLANARAAGLLVWAYHYQTTDPAADQASNIMSMVPGDVPVVLDVEANSGGVGITRDIIGRLNAAGYRTPLLYLPEWYWAQIGSPDLSGLPPLWKSDYPTTNPGPASVLYQSVPASYWNGYGGLPVDVLQFTDNATVANSSVDASAYLGTRDELAALLQQQEDDLTPEQDQMLRDVHEQLYGDGSRGGGNPDGWPQLQPLLPGTDYAGPAKTPVDFIREIHRELCQRLPNRVDGKSTDTVAGYSANADMYGAKLVAAVNALGGAMTQGEADVLSAIKGVTAGSTDVHALAAAIETALPADLAKALGQKLAA